MKLTISKSKNSEQLYICKSYRNANGKSTSKIIKKLGTMESLLPQHNNQSDLFKDINHIVTLLVKTLQKLPVSLRIESELFAVSRTNQTVLLSGVLCLLFF